MPNPNQGIPTSAAESIARARCSHCCWPPCCHSGEEQELVPVFACVLLLHHACAWQVRRRHRRLHRLEWFVPRQNRAQEGSWGEWWRGERLQNFSRSGASAICIRPPGQNRLGGGRKTKSNGSSQDASCLETRPRSATVPPTPGIPGQSPREGSTPHFVMPSALQLCDSDCIDLQAT